MTEIYFANVLYVSSAQEPDYRPLHDETRILIRASSEEEAQSKAEQYGRKTEHEYKSVAGYHIKWRFLEARDIVIATDTDFENDVMELAGWFFHDLETYEKLKTSD